MIGCTTFLPFDPYTMSADELHASFVDVVAAMIGGEADWQSTNLFDVDPKLDPTTSAPLPGSPCIDAGRADVAPSEDFHAAARPVGAGDLGAVERR